MKIEQQLAPLDGAQAENNTTVPEAKTKSKRRVPAKDDDFGDLSDTVNESWKVNTDLTLRYITQPQFEAMVNNYSSTLDVRQEAGGSRPSLTSQLAMADAAIDEALSYVKLYIKKKYEKDAVNQYASFGIERIGRAYGFPANREKRKNCLKLMVKAIAASGFGSEKYGKDFWADMQLQYKNLHNSAKGTDGTVSDMVGDKSVLKAEITMVLNSLIGLLISNHPKTYAAELRKWGFQKEKY